MAVYRHRESGIHADLVIFGLTANVISGTLDLLFTPTLSVAVILSF